MIEFSKEEKAQLSELLKRYVSDEFELELGQFEAEFFLDFIGEKLGGFFYNKGLVDAQTLVEQKVMEIGDSLYEAQKITEFPR